MRGDQTNDDEALALGALGWTLGEDARAGRLLALTGLTPALLRERLEDRAFLAAVLRFLEGHEPDLVACAAALGVPPARLVAARRGAGAVSRPLLISDCDDVLLHFAPHFAEWVAEAHGLGFALDRPGFAGALRDADGAPVARERVWPLLDAFFDREMHRQQLVPGALAALARDRRPGRHRHPHQYRRPVSRQPDRPAGGVRHPPPGALQPGRQGPAGARADRGDEARARRSSSTISRSTTNWWRSTRPGSGGCT